MRTVKRIVCLANSRKLHGRCIAGREWRGGGAGPWIRPVSARDGQEVSEYERQYEDGSDPRVLDVVDVPVLEPRPQGYQTENWLLDPRRYWEKAGRLSPLDLAPLRDPDGPLWIDGHHTWNGRNDKIPLEAAGSVTGSVADAQGLALPGATVVLRTAGRVFVASAVTDRGGGFALAGVPAGDYLLAANLLGFAPREDPVTVGSAGADGVAVTLEVGSFSQEVRVTALMPEVATELAIPAAAIERRVARDLAQSLRGHAGVTALRRGAINLDPSVRGLYAEQIGVFVDGTRTFAAGPARMDSALSHVSPHALQSLRVVRGPYALTWGAGTLSAIQAETFKPAFGGDEFRLGGRAGYNYGSNGRASDGFASLFGSSGRVRFTFQHNTRTGSDHSDGNGDVVEGDYESFDTRWDAGARLGGRTLLEYSGGHQKQNDVDYPGRILDATFFSTRSHALAFSHTPAAGALTEIAGRAYVNLSTVVEI